MPSLPHDLVAAVAADAAADAGGLPVVLLGDFLQVLGGRCPEWSPADQAAAAGLPDARR